MVTNSILPPGLENLAINTQSKPSNKDKLGQSEFLELMLVQIQHQDPLNPMSNGEFLSQLAQFGTVNGITELKSSFDQLASFLQSNQALQASTMVGRTVLVESDVVALNAGENIQGAIELEASTGSLTVLVTSSSGQLIKQINLGSQTAGTVRFTWDGINDNGTAAVPGTYKISAQAVIDNESIAQLTFVQAKVDSVTLSQAGTGPLLNLQGLGSIPISQVKEIK